MAVANAVLDVIENERLSEHAVQVGESMMKDLYQLKDKYSVIGDVRGMGLFIGIELVTSRVTKEPATMLAEYVVSKFKEQRILMSTEGKYGNVLKFKPPMVFNHENAKHLLEKLDEILQEVSNSVQARTSSLSSIQSMDSVNFESFSSDSLSDESDSLISD